MTGSTIGRLSLAMALGLGLAGCQADQPFAFLKKAKPADKTAPAKDKAAAPAESSVKLVDRDVEAPDIYHAKAKALWDGRPSLGGVWVAATDVKEPQRVIIRNPKNGKFVIGALFKREEMNPGPKLQLSSDAAEALGMLAGQPVTVDVTALKRVETPVPSPNPKAPALASNEAIQSKPIADIKAKASAAIDNAAAKGTKEAKTTAKAVAKTGPKAAPTMSAASAAAMAGGKTAPKAPASAPMKAAAGRDYVQIGIFSVEANAKRAARLMRAKGIPARILKEDSHGKTYSRVLAGPTTHARRDGLLAQVKKLGFTDAYFVNK